MLSGSFVSATTGIGTTTLPTVFLLIFLIYDTHTCIMVTVTVTHRSQHHSRHYFTHISVLCSARTGTRKKSNTVITRTCFPSDRCALGQPVGGAVQETAVTIAVTVSCVCVFTEKGYCVRGDLCEFDHGVDPVVIDDVLPGQPLAPQQRSSAAAAVPVTQTLSGAALV